MFQIQTEQGVTFAVGNQPAKFDVEFNWNFSNSARIRVIVLWVNLRKPEYFLIKFDEVQRRGDVIILSVRHLLQV